MANEYTQGEVVRVTGTFTNAVGSAVDPTTVRFSFKTPLGVTTTYLYGTDAQVVKSATGIYYVDVDADLSGVWRTRWKSTGTGKAAKESFFVVKESDFD